MSEGIAAPGAPDRAAPKPKARAPEGRVVDAARREMPDVDRGEVAAAGAVAEAIETDYWFLSDRREAGYLDQAAKKAAELGYPLAADLPRDPPRSYDAAAGYGGFDIFDPQGQLEEERRMGLLGARRKFPAEFADVPITRDEIARAAAEDLRAEWEDAQATLKAAPPGLFSRGAPEFIGRAATAMTDEVNLPLAIATGGIGAEASLARIVLMETAASVAGEGLTLPKQFAVAERLDLPEPNAAAQLAFAATIGAALPLGIAGAGRALGAGVRGGEKLTNRVLVNRLRKRAGELAPLERAAASRIEREIAETDTGPARAPRAQTGETDQALADMDRGAAPREDVPELSAERIADLIVPPRAPAPEPVRQPPRSVEGNLGVLIREAEARSSYDTPSDFTIIAPPRALTEMTLDEVDAWQGANIAAGAQSTAAGGYQIIRGTLAGLRESLGLTGAEKFDAGMQDRLGIELMREAGLDAYKSGAIGADDFADSLAAVWAALPLEDGRSVYAGDGLNAAHVARDTVMDILAGVRYDAASLPPPRMSRVPAAGILVDPKTYQFRTDVDASGVGTALDRVSEWDELLAGDFIIHERGDGQRFIADGHHRRQLAARLEAEGHPPIDFNGYVLREADGYSVEAVRAIAAVKNIEAGNATAVDVAKVLRLDPAMMEKLTLRNAQARDGRGLMKLSDLAFDMVTNRQVEEPHAAFVGELTRDGEMQEAVLRALIAVKPRSMAEARQVARDAMNAGIARREAGAQGSLFGDDFDAAETLFKERAEVLARALSQLRNDRRVFATLIKERNRIREAGNALTDEANAARVDTDATAIDLIEILVNRAGPLNDALTRAAGRARNGRGLRGATDEFLKTVRGAVEGGDLGRLMDGGAGNAGDAAPPGAATDAGARARPGEGADPDGPGGREGRGEDGEVAAGQPEVKPKPKRTGPRGGDAAADGGLFELGARDQTGMFSDAGRAEVGLGRSFDDPGVDAPEVAAQAEAAENELRAAMAAGEDLFLPTGREIDGEPEIMSGADLFGDLDTDKDFLEILNVCKI